jgi:endonuclease/exonuclease/phosphatase family metal-dependent hydrolase
MKVLTFNVLHPYAQAASKCSKTWKQRLDDLIEVTVRHSPDIVCLQEVDALTAVEDWYVPMVRHGYRGWHTLSKSQKRAVGKWSKKVAKRPMIMVCVTFVKDVVVQIVSQTTHHRYTITRVVNGGQETVIGNVHAPTRQTHDETRQFILGLLKEFELYSTCPAILCGDFNTEIAVDQLNTAYQKLTLDSSCPQGTYFSERSGIRSLDHVIVRGWSGSLVTFHADPNVATMAAALPLPSTVHPSDHLPVLASLAETPTQQTP